MNHAGCALRGHDQAHPTPEHRPRPYPDSSGPGKGGVSDCSLMTAGQSRRNLSGSAGVDRCGAERRGVGEEEIGGLADNGHRTSGEDAVVVGTDHVGLHGHAGRVDTSEVDAGGIGVAVVTTEVVDPDGVADDPVAWAGASAARHSRGASAR